MTFSDNRTTDGATHPIHQHQTVLVVDDDEGVRSVLRRLLSAEGYDVQLAHDGPSALAGISAASPDIVLLDVRMPGPLDGFEICRRLRQDLQTRLTPIIILTAFDQREFRLQSIEVSADDFLTKPLDRDQLLARMRSLIKLKHYTDDLDSAASILMTLASLVEGRDGHSEGHCHRMANYATRLGRALALGDDDLQSLYRGGFLHDIGMLVIPDSIVRRKGPLEAGEYELVKSHTTIGDDLCANLRSLHKVRPIIRHHHERLDGSGYPDGLRGDEIPVLAQIAGVVDVYEGVTTQAPYQSAQSMDDGIGALRSHAERGRLSHDLVERFVDLMLLEQSEHSMMRPPLYSVPHA